MRYLVPTTILAALFSFSAFAADMEVAKVAPEAQEELCDETTLLLPEEGDAEEVAQLTDDEQLLKAKAKAAPEAPKE